MRNRFIFNAPSEDFSGINAALPFGNGYIGAQVEDNIVYERIALNESTLWSGGPYENDMPQALEHLSELRESALHDCPRDFDWENRFVGMWGGQIMLPAGDLMVYFANSRETSGYRKEIDLRRAVLSTVYDKKGERIGKEYFADYPSDVVCIRYTNSEKKMNFSCEIVSKSTGKLCVEGDTLLFEGRANGARGVDGAIRYAIAARVRTDGETEVVGRRLLVKNAGTTDIFLTIATNFVSDCDLSADYLGTARRRVDEAFARGYEALKEEHVRDFSALYGKTEMELDSPSEEDLPVKELQRRFAENGDPAWTELYFNFTRYLILSCTRNGTQPPSLQGLWNDKLSPPWDCKYTVNINLEMNYWSLAPLGWSELYGSLLEKMLRVMEKGKKTAKTMYGISRGDAWVMHHNTDLWNVCGAIDGCWGITPVCGAWLINELFTGYEYTQDKEYLKKLYPLFKGCAEFFCDFLVEHEGWLVTCPSTSPERMNGPLGYVTYGSAHDNQIVREMFENYLVCEKECGANAALAREVREKADRLPPPVRIGSWGEIMEFYFHEYDFPEDTHRHLAHLYGVYPGRSVSRLHDKAVDAAVRTTLDCRSRPGDWTGWGIVWRIALYARIGCGEKVGEMLRTFLDRRNGLLLENGFGALPYENGSAFQYDCNGGFPAAYLEAFVRSEEGRASLLPALPAFVRGGRLAGVCLRGGFTVEEITFADGKVTGLTLSSKRGGALCLTVNGSDLSVSLQAGETRKVI